MSLLFDMGVGRKHFGFKTKPTCGSEIIADLAAIQDGSLEIQIAVSRPWKKRRAYVDVRKSAA